MDGRETTNEASMSLRERVKITSSLEAVPGYRCEACNNVVWALVCPCGGLTDAAVTVLSEMDEIPVGGGRQ